MTELIINRIRCPRCLAALTNDFFTDPSGSICRNCGLIITGRLFPRFFNNNTEEKSSTEASSDYESSCFFHQKKLAVSHCSECGRFLCALCELNIEDRILCPICLEKLDQEKRLKTFTNQITFWDSITVSMAILPLLLWPLTIITAPLTLIYIWRHFKDNNNHIIPRKRWRFYIAGLFAGIELTGWAIFLVIFIVR
ncbi:MAG: hypothetical protein ACMUHX_10625 [bacterium]